MRVIVVHHPQPACPATGERLQDGDVLSRRHLFRKSPSVQQTTPTIRGRANRSYPNSSGGERSPRNLTDERRARAHRTKQSPRPESEHLTWVSVVILRGSSKVRWKTSRMKYKMPHMNNSLFAPWNTRPDDGQDSLASYRQASRCRHRLWCTIPPTQSAPLAIPATNPFGILYRRDTFGRYGVLTPFLLVNIHIRNVYKNKHVYPEQTPTRHHHTTSLRSHHELYTPNDKNARETGGVGTSVANEPIHLFRFIK